MGVSAAQVGSYFVGQYYQVLPQQPNLIHQFYLNNSTMVRVDGDSTESVSDVLNICKKNTENRQNQMTPHTLGSKLIARKQHELESSHGRKYSRIEMYTICHKKNDGSFVNDEAKGKSEKLAILENEGASSEDAFVAIFGKERPGYVRGKGLGVCSSQIVKYSSTHCEGPKPTCSYIEDSAKIQQLEAQMNYLITFFWGKNSSRLSLCWTQRENKFGVVNARRLVGI